MALHHAKLCVSLFRHPCRTPPFPGKGENTGAVAPATLLLGRCPKPHLLKSVPLLQRSKKERMVIYMTGILWYDTVICVLVFIFGSVIGSFLNVVIYRTPLHMSIVNGPSHCFSCGERIKPYDGNNVPARLHKIFGKSADGGRNCILLIADSPQLY